MRRKPNTAAMPIQDRIGFSPAPCQSSGTYRDSRRTRDHGLLTSRPKLNNQKLAYDVAGWTRANDGNIRNRVSPAGSATSPSGAPTWQFNVDVNPTDGLKITDLKLHGQPGDPFKAADDVCEWIAFQNLWVKFR